jgi:2'-5' RNA ligase
VPPPFGEALDEYRRRVEGTLETPAHITLVPPTPVADHDWDDVHDLLRSTAARHQPFRVRLAGAGSFRPVSPVVFVVVVEGISGCEQLEASLRVGPLSGARPFPYHPHVTIAHDVGEERMDRALLDHADFAADFVVDGFALFRSDTTGWTAVAEYPLGGGGR